MEKKEYTAPKMTVVDMELESSLLAGSTDGAPDVEEYEGEFGLNFDVENTKNA